MLPRLLLTWGVIDLDLAVFNESEGSFLLHTVFELPNRAITAEARMG